MEIIDYRNQYLNDNKATATTLALGKKCTRYNVIKYYNDHFVKDGYRVINMTRKPKPPLILFDKQGRMIAVEVEKTKNKIMDRMTKIKDKYYNMGFDIIIVLHYSLDKTILSKLKGNQLDIIIKKIEGKKRYLNKINSLKIIKKDLTKR